MNRFLRAVMAGLVPAIHVFSPRGNEDVDARDKPGHDEFVGTPITSNGHMRLPYACGGGPGWGLAPRVVLWKEPPPPPRCGRRFASLVARRPKSELRSSRPRKRRGVRGMIHCVAVHARQDRGKSVFSGCRDTEGLSMRYRGSIFGRLLEPINRRQFQTVVDRLDGDAYDKSFRSWDHLVALIYAQLSGNSSLRGVVTGFNANSQHHYHLGTGKLSRSTLSDANARRPIGIFAQTFAALSAMARRQLRSEGMEMVRLIDASPIPLGKVCSWATWNGRIRGMKLHVVYDPRSDVPTCVEMTAANVNDIEIGRQTPIQPATTYVFDKGYCRFDWWQKINDSKAFFVTRAKTSIRLRSLRHRAIRKRNGDGFEILADDEVKLTSKGDSRLPIPLRRIKIRREKGGKITLLTNDLARSAVEIAALYKSRWQIELLFRWIKQHLDIRKFLGANDNAIRLQVLAAMIAYLLLRIAAHTNCIKMLPLRFAELVGQLLLTRRSLAAIDKPPPINPSRRKSTISPDQMELRYA
ncbi:putative transposase [Bradyrhizobium sp. USDA 4508]